MASEALDIKSLTTLVLATPKTDVEQAVGRILREKHSNPLVIDIIDTHKIFENQWTKRKDFYLKNNYNIIYTNNYKDDKWEKIEKKKVDKKSKEERKCLINL